MTKESIVELQKIDCNCNDCKFMVRDFDSYMKWEFYNMVLQQDVFKKKKQASLDIANECKDSLGKKTLLNIANKMEFIFDKSKLLQYGVCNKLNKSVSFIPNTCQIETQTCFQHRKN